MNIAFDLDRIFINYPPLVSTSVIDWFYKNRRSQVLSYNIPYSYPAKLLRRLTHVSTLRPPIKKNVVFLHHFAKQFPSHKLFLISSRYQFLENLTKKLLEKNNISIIFSKIYLNTKNEQPHFFKEKAIKEQNIELYIDDDLELLKYLQKTCPKTKLLWYNPGYSQTEETEITTIKDLSEIKKYLK